MRYQVNGQDRTSGKRRIVDIDAKSPAEAEKRGREMGIDVRSVRKAPSHDEIEGEGAGAGSARPSSRVGLWALVLLLIGVAIAYVVWRYVLNA